MKFQQLQEGLGQDADDMEHDHEVQMARADCFHAARNAIDLHRMLRNISEREGLEGWVSEKITLAADYLRTVKEYLEYETGSKQSISDMIQPKSPDDYNEIFSQYMDESVKKTQSLSENQDSTPSDKEFSKKIKTQNLSARGRELLIKAFAKFPQSNNEIDAIINYLEYVKRTGDVDIGRLGQENQIQDREIDDLESTTVVDQQQINKINQRLRDLEQDIAKPLAVKESRKNKRTMKEMATAGATSVGAVATAVAPNKKIMKRAR